MTRAAAVALLLVGACHKHDADPTPAPTTTAAAPAPSETVAAAPSDSAAPAPAASASAAANASDPDSARQQALREASQAGILGLLASDAGTSSIFGSGGLDAGLTGNMWGDPTSDSFGAGGLGLRGTGPGGGTGQGTIGLGNIGTIGHGGGGGAGYGMGHGGSTHQARLRQGVTTVNGRLPPEVVQRIVRQNFGRFRLCYEDGLRRDPKLAGKVAIKFIIDRQGNVANVSRDPSTTMSDAAVVSCVQRGFSSLVFPQPEGGIVTVIFPVIFDPGS